MKNSAKFQNIKKCNSICYATPLFIGHTEKCQIFSKHVYFRRIFNFTYTAKFMNRSKYSLLRTAYTVPRIVHINKLRSEVQLMKAQIQNAFLITAEECSHLVKV